MVEISTDDYVLIAEYGNECDMGYCVVISTGVVVVNGLMETKDSEVINVVAGNVMVI